MASDETMMFQSCLQEEEEFDDDDIDDDGFDHHHHQHQHQHHQLQHPHPHNSSRLSVCTSSTLCDVDDEDDDVDNAMTMYVSRLSIESLEGDENDGDADGELSEDGKDVAQEGLSCDSENEVVNGCYSLPATPPRSRKQGKTTLVGLGAKDYASDNDENRRRRRRRRRNRRETRGVFDQRGNHWWWEKKKGEDEEEEHVSGESTDQSGGTGLVLITRPKGGKRTLCMDLEEVKACRDLGFELEHHRMLEMPSSRLSFSNSSSGGNSPIANWRISGPGDDPRDVKARLKVWAQAVALASASSKYGT